MPKRPYFWGFKDKDQRRHEKELTKQNQKQSHLKRTADIEAHTHLDHVGRKGFLGLEQLRPSFLRHSRNTIYARWARRQTKTSPDVIGDNQAP